MRLRPKHAGTIVMTLFLIFGGIYFANMIGNSLGGLNEES